MKGIYSIAVFCLLAKYSEAQIKSWTETDFTATAATTGKPDVTMTKKVKVSEKATAIMTLVAAPTGTSSPVVKYAFTALGNPGSVGSIATDTTGAITVASGKSLDYETAKSLVFVVTATEQGVTTNQVVGTATVTVDIQNVVEFSQTHYAVCASDGATTGTTLGTYTVADKASDDTMAYTLSSTTTFEVGATTGVLTVKTGVTLAMKTIGGYDIDLTGTPTPGSSATTAATAATTKLWITVGTCSSSAMQVTVMLGMVMLSFATALFL